MGRQSGCNLGWFNGSAALFLEILIPNHTSYKPIKKQFYFTKMKAK